MRPTGLRGDEGADAGGVSRYARYLIAPFLFFIVYNMMTRDYTGETRDVLGDRASEVVPLTASERAAEVKSHQKQFLDLLRNVSTLMEERRSVLRDISDIKSTLRELKEGQVKQEELLVEATAKLDGASG